MADQSKQLITIDLEWVDHMQETAEEQAVAPQPQVELVVEPLMTRDNLQTTHSMLRVQACITLSTRLEVAPRIVAVVHHLLELDQHPVQVMLVNLEAITIRDLHLQIE